MAYDRIFFLKLPYRGLLTLKVILHALKDKIRVLILRKGITSELGGRLHEKGCGLMRASGRQEQCRGLGQQSQLKTWGAQMESSYLPIPSVSLWIKGLLSSFHP